MHACMHRGWYSFVCCSDEQRRSNNKYLGDDNGDDFDCGGDEYDDDGDSGGRIEDGSHDGDGDGDRDGDRVS